MAKINEFGEIIRDSSEEKLNDNTIPTFTPPKLDYAKEGDKILDTGYYEYHGASFNLQTLENLANRLESEIRSGIDGNIYADEILTIAMQMQKKAQQAINTDTQITPQKEARMKAILDKMTSLNAEGMLLNPATLLKHSEQAQEYIRALQEEMEKQQLLDQQAKSKASSDWGKKAPTISAKTSYDVDGR